MEATTYAIPKVGTIVDIGSFAYKVRKITKTDLVLRAFDFSDAQKFINEQEAHGGLILPRKGQK